MEKIETERLEQFFNKIREANETGRIVNLGVSRKTPMRDNENGWQEIDPNGISESSYFFQILE